MKQCTIQLQESDDNWKIIENTWLDMYPRPIEAIYYWVLLLFGHEFKNALIKK